MSSYTPAEIAAGDQHYAEVESNLDGLIAHYREKLVGESRVEALDFVGQLLACPHLADGTELTPREHAGTLANTLAVAIDRLARA